ncbi:alpha/beta fold hydrolase [Polaromonas sp. OV174]|uniref:alpha/beta fold hydrolase n=1 Tax=Polaromonas sp. OV174 TaxID=1855300 RepID=UPI0015A70DA3|nr:alpha/beta fold hydrolase [Polaromonas sp. OV174]
MDNLTGTAGNDTFNGYILDAGATGTTLTGADVINGGAGGVCNIKNFGFESGESISDLRLHYSTLGTPQYDAAGQICNAVLLLHSSTGNRLHWLSEPLGSELFGPGQPLDASRYFIILPDLIGHGQSSKPSDGLRTRFPRYRCRDMVNVLHLLVSQGLGIRQLQLVMGTSLGAMLAWLWGQMYPESSARLVPMGAYPLALGGRNWIIRRMIIEAIRHDPSWEDGNYTKPPTSYLYTAPLLILLAHGVQQLQDLAPNRHAADQYYEQLIKTVAQHDANDLLYILEATHDFDPSPDLEKITTRVLAINFTGDEICRPEISELDTALKRLPDARFVLVPATRQSCGHLTYYQPDTWKAHLAEFLN